MSMTSVTLATWVRKEDDIADSQYFSRIHQFQSRAVRCGYFKEATFVNEFSKSDKQVLNAVTREEKSKFRIITGR